MKGGDVMDGVELQAGDVGELTPDGARVLYKAGTPEAETWFTENSAPHGLDEADREPQAPSLSENDDDQPEKLP